MSHSQKISSFTGQSLLDNADQFTFVRNATNFKVAFSDLKADLGVTGTLNQVGDPLGAPVLDQPSPLINNIRNLESGAGILTSVSAQDGIIIKTDFVQGSAGIPLIKSLTAKQQLFKSFIAGNGITIDDIGDDIRITAIDAIISTKTVVISQESDFPAAVGGVITLDTETKYQLVNDVTTANRFILSNRTVLAGDGPNLSLLTYTGTGTMFTWVDSTVDFESLRCTAPLATLFSGSSAGRPEAAFIVRQCTFEACEVIGTIADTFALTWTDAGFLSVNSDGLLFDGSMGFMLLESSIVIQQSGTILDFGTCTFDGFTLINSVVIGTGSPVFLDGLPDSGNVNAGGIGTIVNNRSQGPISAGNINPDNSLWEFLLNDTIPDTRRDAILSVQNNATLTTIPALDTPVKVNATWTIERVSGFSADTAGTITHTQEKNVISPITVSISGRMDTQNDKDCTFYLAIGTGVLTSADIIDGTGIQLSLHKDKTFTCTLVWQQMLIANQVIELWVEQNEGALDDILLVSSVFRIN